MNTGNGRKPNPMGRFGGTPKKETRNMVKDSTGKPFNAGSSALAKSKKSSKKY